MIRDRLVEVSISNEVERPRSKKVVFINSFKRIYYGLQKI